METKAKDLAARICKLKTESGTIETPCILPVVNPNRRLITPEELKKAGAQALITNSYVIWRTPELREKVLKKGIHSLLGFKGPVMTDSGAFQQMRYGEIEVTNREIIEFQESMNVDIGVILDYPGITDKKTTEENVNKTIKNAKEAKKLTKKSKTLWCGPIQGGPFLDLRERSAKEMAKLDFDVYPIGTAVPLLTDYDFAIHVDIIPKVKQIIPLSKPVHLFGAGHPMFLAFAVALGIDLFDSAAYSLFAKRRQYLTVSGTKDLGEMKYLPCSCSACSSSQQPEEMDEKSLALHNLYTTFEEMRRIKQSIRENTLWELLEERARAHPALYKAFKAFSKHRAYLESLDVLSKKHFFYLSKESMNRPEIYRHETRMKEGYFKSRKLLDLFPFKDVPCEVLDMYPFGQRVLPEDTKPAKPKVSDLEIVNGVAQYLYGIPALFPKTCRIEKSKKTGRIRAVYEDEKLLATFRASDFIMVPHGIAEKIHEKSPKNRVVLVNDPEAVSFVKQGRSVFAKFVKDCDPGIRAGFEVLVVDSKDNLANKGKALLSAREMCEMDEGAAVSFR
jgi:7-cyano-7-deazaguanine tRNA-ribosyltransferase